MVARVGQSAITQQERMQYADLHGYLDQVDEYHRELNVSPKASDVPQRQAVLSKYRGRLEKIFE